MNQNLEKWLSEMKKIINDNTTILKKGNVSEYFFYLQRQIAIANEIELKKIELKYLNKDKIMQDYPIKDDKYNFEIT